MSAPSSAGISLRISGVTVEHYGSLGSMDALGALLFGEGALSREKPALLEIFDRLGVTQEVAAWLPRWPGVMDSVGVGGVLLPDADIAWADDAHIPAIFAYTTRESLGGWQPMFSFIDTTAWALTLGLSDKRTLEQLVRLTYWRTILESSHQALHQGAELDPGQAPLAPSDIPPQGGAIERTKETLKDVLIILCKKVLSTFESAPPGILEIGSLTAYRLAATMTLERFGMAVEEDELLLKRSTELRVQQWLPLLPPSLAESARVGQTLAAITRYERRLTVSALESLIRELSGSTSPHLWGPALSRALRVDGSSQPLGGLIDWFSQQNIPLTGPWRALLWRAPLEASRLLNDALPAASLLLAVARGALSPPHLTDPDDWLPVAVSSAWRVVEAGKPSLGFAALRALCERSVPPARQLVQALRGLLSSTYGRSQSLDLGSVPYLLPGFDPSNPPSVEQDAQNLARILHDALLASLLEPQAASAEDANRLFVARIQQGLLYLERDPTEPQTQRKRGARARHPDRPPLAALVGLLVFLVLVIVFAGWFILTVAARR